MFQKNDRVKACRKNLLQVFNFVYGFILIEDCDAFFENKYDELNQLDAVKYFAVCEIELSRETLIIKVQLTKDEYESLNLVSNEVSSKQAEMMTQVDFTDLYAFIEHAAN